jgi:hypothetical protein
MADLSSLQRFLAPSAPPSDAVLFIEQANRSVSIEKVLFDHFGIEVGPGKNPCPFDFEHSDGGQDKALRVYPDTNSAYCFALHGVLDPVKLFSLKGDNRPLYAAQLLMRAYGIDTRPKGWRERYNDIALQRETSVRQIPPGSVVEALQAALRQDQGYVAHQFHPDVLRAVEGQLDAIDKLVSQTTDIKEIQEWLTQAKATILTSCPKSPPSTAGSA